MHNPHTIFDLINFQAKNIIHHHCSYQYVLCIIWDEIEIKGHYRAETLHFPSTTISSNLFIFAVDIGIRMYICVCIKFPTQNEFPFDGQF